MTWIAFLTDNALKATVLLGAACIMSLWLRKASSSLRHFLWTAAFASLIGLPAAVLVMPRWGLVMPAFQRPAPVIPAAAPARTARIVTTGQTAPREAPRTPSMLLLVWAAGCVLAAGRFVVGVARTSWMVRRAHPADYAEEATGELRRSLGLGSAVRALESSHAPMPLMWGVLRPVIVLPEGAAAWPPARLRTVLLHELVHVSRGDLLAQTIARAACCLYWFHPLAWFGLSQLRKERERACDDAVLLSGLAAHDYAGHLLELVRTFAAKRNRWAEAPAMAESSDLESRVRALLDRRRNRKPVSRRTAVAIATAAVAVLAPLAALHAQADPGMLAGLVSDPSGARIPNCRVTAKNVNGSNQEVAMSNEAGEYRFVSIPAGQYALEFAAKGFALAKTQAVVVSGAPARVDGHLELGSVTESIVIRGQKPAATSAVRPAPNPERVRVGGAVTPGRLLRQPRPVYPAELQQLGVEGTVIISAIISKTGTVLSPTVRNTVDRRLADLALDAVRSWVYEPALLNGEPVETLTTITLEFQLGQ